MRATMALVLCLYAGTLWAQYPAPGWGYFNKNEALRQQQWENQFRLRQQQAWERTLPERNYVLDFAEQATRIRANKEQERYYRELNDRLEEQPRRSDNPFLNNPFLRR